MLDPNHLIELAQQQANAPGGGAPRQVVLRRAVSTAYYAAFHALAGNSAETFVPAALWKSRVLFYRAIDHGKTKARCKKLGQNPLPDDEKNFFGITSFSAELRMFANTFVLLQELRHRCDYDPDYKIVKDQAIKAVDDARRAITCLHTANPDVRNQFLAYILFGMRAQ